MRILAIDPGYERLGIAVIERVTTKDDRAENNRAKNVLTRNGVKDSLLFSDCFKTPAKLAFNERLKLIGAEIARVIEKYEPESLAIETLFFTNNQKTAMNVSEARGVVVYEAARHSLAVFEYSPLQIKIAVTGYGRSDKKQMIAMIPRLIAVSKKIAHDDEYDAIAAGITCLASYKSAMHRPPFAKKNEI